MRTLRSGKYARVTAAKGEGLGPYTLPEMFGISTDPAFLSAAGRFHNG
jgi:hypothetical protein